MREAAAAAGRAAARCRGGGGGGRGGASASAVGAGVAELEALVDRGGSRAAGCPTAACATDGQFAYEPVRRRSRVDRGRRRARRRSSSRRAGSRPGRRRCARSAPSAARRRRARSGRRAGRRAASNDCAQLERALLEPRLDVAGGALGDDRLEAVVGEPGRGCAHVLGERRRRARPGPTRRARRASSAVDDADVGQPVLERGVEEQLAPAALARSARIAASSSRAARTASASSVELAAADADACRRGSGGR